MRVVRWSMKVEQKDFAARDQFQGKGNSSLAGLAVSDLALFRVQSQREAGPKRDWSHARPCRQTGKGTVKSL